MNATREQRIERALFQGSNPMNENPKYRDAVRTLTEVLLHTNLATPDLTVESLRISDRPASAFIMTRDGGVVAGWPSWPSCWKAWRDLAFDKDDGDVMQPADVLLRATDHETKLLSLERVGVNLVQRICRYLPKDFVLPYRGRPSCQMQ
jgi:nicotinate-nucleotide pyrophosphorylase